MSSDDNNNTTKTMDESVDQFSAQDMDDNPSVASDSRILIDDALIHIFKCLSLKDLLAIESVSNQFRECVSTRLKSRKSLTIGDGNNVDINCITLIPNRLTLDSLLRKCPNIDSLDIKNTHIDYPTLEVIVNGCPQLTHLSLLETFLDEKSVTDGNYVYRYMQLVSQSLPQLKSLTINIPLVVIKDPNDRPVGVLYQQMVKELLYLFTELNVLRLVDGKEMMDLAYFIHHLVANRKSRQDFTLDLCSQSDSDELKSMLWSMNISLPNYIHIQ